MQPIVTDRVASSVGLSVTVVSPAKTAEPIEMPFGIWTRVGPRKHVLGAVHNGATWRIPLNRPRAAAMRPVVKLLSDHLFLHYKPHAVTPSEREAHALQLGGHTQYAPPMPYCDGTTHRYDLTRRYDAGA